VGGALHVAHRQLADKAAENGGDQSAPMGARSLEAPSARLEAVVGQQERLAPVPSMQDFAQEPWASWALAAQQRMTALRAAQVAWEASPFSWHPQSLQEAGRLCRGEAAENRHWERLRHRAAFCERIQRCLWSHQLAPEG